MSRLRMQFVNQFLRKGQQRPRSCTAFPCCLASREAVWFIRVVTNASVDITAAIGRKRFLAIKQQGHGRDTSISMVSSLQRF
jgi:hypothetical protein